MELQCSLFDMFLKEVVSVRKGNIVVDMPDRIGYYTCVNPSSEMLFMQIVNYIRPMFLIRKDYCPNCTYFIPESLSEFLMKVSIKIEIGVTGIAFFDRIWIRSCKVMKHRVYKSRIFPGSLLFLVKQGLYMVRKERDLPRIFELYSDLSCKNQIGSLVVSESLLHITLDTSFNLYKEVFANASCLL